MKRRDSGQQASSVREDLSPRQVAQAALAQALASVDSTDQMVDFLADLCTPAELEALADRWTVVPLLADGVSYRQVHEQTGVSVTTVGRVARCLERGTGGYRAVLALNRDEDRGDENRGQGLGHTRGAQPAQG